MPNVNYGYLDAAAAERSKRVPLKTRQDLKNSMAHPQNGNPAAALFFQTPGEWVRQAACSGMPTSKFFPSNERGYRVSKNPAILAAVAVCRGCPVTAECLKFAEDSETEYGVFGGVYFNHGRRSHVAA